MLKTQVHLKGKKISREFNFADEQNVIFRGNLISRIEVLEKFRGNLISWMMVYTFFSYKHGFSPVNHFKLRYAKFLTKYLNV